MLILILNLSLMPSAHAQELISAVDVQKIATTAVRIGWQTSSVMNCSLVYDTNDNFDRDTIESGSTKKIVFAATSTFGEIDELRLDTLYYFQIVCRDRSSNQLLAETIIRTLLLEDTGFDIDVQNVVYFGNPKASILFS